MTVAVLMAQSVDSSAMRVDWKKETAKYTARKVGTASQKIDFGRDLSLGQRPKPWADFFL